MDTGRGVDDGADHVPPRAEEDTKDHANYLGVGLRIAY